MNKLNLPDNLIRLRHEKHLTQEELADFMGVTKASVSKWEKGMHTPDLLLLPQLASFFDVTVDELIGYDSQLSSEQIRRKYAELSKDFATLAFDDALENARALAHKYYACYPLLLQLSILYCNHYMLAKTEQQRRAILQEAAAWCDRIMENSNDVGLCGDALVLKAGLQLQLGKALEAIDALELSADPSRFAAKSAGLLIQAYQSVGHTKKAKSFAQAKQYLDLLELTNDAVLEISLHMEEIGHCEETIRRVTGLLELYQLETLQPNTVAQFHFQCAVFYATYARAEEALAALARFERCVDRILKSEPCGLHGDDYFYLLDEWIDRLPLGNMLPRDKSFIHQHLRDPLAHPAFASIQKQPEFQRLVRRLTQGGEENA